MLKTILSISGKPGLYKLISHGKNMLIVESIDKLYNELPIRRNPYCMGWADHSMIGIISAKLAHNPEYDKIKDTYIRIVKKQTYSEYFRQSFYRAIDYLEKAGV